MNFLNFVKNAFIITFSIFFIVACSSKAKKSNKKAEELSKDAVAVKEGKDQKKMMAPEKAKKTHWGYTGLVAPSLWGDLDKKYKVCKEGQKQSPVDLVFSRPVTNRKIEFTYSSSPLRVINNGHTVVLKFEKGSSVSIDGKFYELIQVHFHSPSEHSLSGRLYPMEIHFVHKNANDELAVLGVLVKAGNTNYTISNIWPHLPSKQNIEIKKEDVKINPLDLIPRSRTHYSYAGSLTTPPCTEGVNWTVFNNHLELSPAQINSFQKLYNGNNRPVQPLHSRKTNNHK